MGGCAPSGLSAVAAAPWPPGHRPVRGREAPDLVPAPSSAAPAGAERIESLGPGRSAPAPAGGPGAAGGTVGLRKGKDGTP